MQFLNPGGQTRTAWVTQRPHRDGDAPSVVEVVLNSHFLLRLRVLRFGARITLGEITALLVLPVPAS